MSQWVRTAFRSAGGFSVVGADDCGEMARAEVCGSSGAEGSGAGKVGGGWPEKGRLRGSRPVSVNQALEGRRHATKASRGYNHGRLCLLHQAQNWVPTRSSRLWVPEAWAKFIARGIRDWSAR